MDRELKAPYVPPKSKIITDKEIQKQLSMNKPVMKEISVRRGVNHSLGRPDAELQKGEGQRPQLGQGLLT